jgi:dolichol-phosphate mannosyltransferase
MQTLDIVTSAKNEVENIPLLFKEIQIALAEENYEWRLIICDNDSSDETWNAVEKLVSENDNVIGIQMSRDFGFEASIYAGIKEADVDLVVMMTSDLQDPPSAIPQFLRQYEKGFDHVYQIVGKRPGSHPVRNVNSKIFYFFAKRFSGGLIEENSSVFRLISGDLKAQLVKLEERNRFVRALIPWLGYKSIGIEVPRENRRFGETKASSRVAMKYAVKGVLSNSYSLLDFIGIMGILLFTLSFVSLLIVIGIWIVQGVPFPGFGLLLSTSLLGFGLVLLCLGVIAQYLSLIYEEVKARPNYIVKRKIG